VVVGWMEFVMDANNKRNSCCARLDIWDESPITLEGELKLIVLEALYAGELDLKWRREFFSNAIKKIEQLAGHHPTPKRSS